MPAKALRLSFSPRALVRDFLDARAAWKATEVENLDFYTRANVNVFNLHEELAGIAKKAHATPPQKWEYMKPRQKPADFPPMPSGNWHLSNAATEFNNIVMGKHPAIIAIPLEETPFSFFGNTTQRMAFIFDASVRDMDPLFSIKHAIRFRGETESGRHNDLLCIKDGAQGLRFENMRVQYTNLLQGRETILVPEDMRPAR